MAKPTSRFALAGPPRDPPEVGTLLRPVLPLCPATRAVLGQWAQWQNPRDFSRGFALPDRSPPVRAL